MHFYTQKEWYIYEGTESFYGSMDLLPYPNSYANTHNYFEFLKVYNWLKL